MLLIPVGRLDVPPIELLLRAQIRLGQRRATKGNHGLAADERHPTGEAFFAKRCGGIAPREAAANDHDRLIGVRWRHPSGSRLDPYRGGTLPAGASVASLASMQSRSW